MAIRAALGAGRRRLVLPAAGREPGARVAGGGLGLLLAYLAIEPVQALSAGSIPRVADVAIDGNVLAFALGLAAR